jgi:hypothetical protein
MILRRPAPAGRLFLSGVQRDETSAIERKIDPARLYYG